MTTITDHMIRDEERQGPVHGRIYTVARKLTLPNGAADSGDDIKLLNMPANHALIDMQIGNRGTLGASCTLTGRVATTAVTAATTAGSASRVRTSAAAPFDSENAQSVNLLVGGGDITAEAIVDVLMTFADCTGAS